MVLKATHDIFEGGRKGNLKHSTQQVIRTKRKSFHDWKNITNLHGQYSAITNDVRKTENAWIERIKQALSRSPISIRRLIKRFRLSNRQQ